MIFGDDLINLAIIAMTALAVGGVIFAIVIPYLNGTRGTQRVKALTTGKREQAFSSFRARLQEDQKDSRRRQIQESLKEVSQKNKKKRISLREALSQAGLEISTRAYWVASAVLGAALAVASLIFGIPIYGVVAIAFVGFLGLPRWVLGFLRKRRQNTFLKDFADAIDVMVRGLKSGLPINEAMKIIATESGPPVGPEFAEVLEGQRIGIPVDQGVERMYERIPLPEVNFLAIVLTIQAKTGGNLSEALANLSRVLRDRKKMKAKIRAVSQEAKSSAAIIGSLPIALIGILSFVNPTYVGYLFHTQTGNMCLVACGIWMSIGTLIMRKMINFQI